MSNAQTYETFLRGQAEKAQYGVVIDIPMPEDCENCLICSLVPEHARLDLHEHGLQYRLYCKVTGACVSGKGRGKACPLHRCKTGKWERHYTRPNVYADLYWHCSCCGYKTPDSWAYKWEYCPNCGAKMDGGEEE